MENSVNENPVKDGGPPLSGVVERAWVGGTSVSSSSSAWSVHCSDGLPSFFFFTELLVCWFFTEWNYWFRLRRCFTAFYWFKKGFRCALPSFTEFYRVLPNCVQCFPVSLRFYRVALGFYRVSLNCFRLWPIVTGFYRVSASSTAFYRVLPSFVTFGRSWNRRWRWTTSNWTCSTCGWSKWPWVRL